MKYRLATIVILLMVITSLSNGGDNELKWQTFNQGLTEAKKSNKKILVDVFTDWCKWCKVMDKETYSNPEVMSLLNQYFVVVKLDAESNKRVTYDNKTFTERTLASAFGVDGYPTTLFLDSEGILITSADGYIKAPMFIDILRFIGEDHFKTMKWEEYQEKQKTKGKKNSN